MLKSQPEKDPLIQSIRSPKKKKKKRRKIRNEKGSEERKKETSKSFTNPPKQND